MKAFPSTTFLIRCKRISKILDDEDVCKIVILIRKYVYSCPILGVRQVCNISYPCVKLQTSCTPNEELTDIPISREGADIQSTVSTGRGAGACSRLSAILLIRGLLKICAVTIKSVVTVEHWSSVCVSSPNKFSSLISIFLWKVCIIPQK